MSSYYTNPTGSGPIASSDFSQNGTLPPMMMDGNGSPEMWNNMQANTMNSWSTVPSAGPATLPPDTNLPVSSDNEPPVKYAPYIPMGDNPASSSLQVNPSVSPAASGSVKAKESEVSLFNKITEGSNVIFIVVGVLALLILGFFLSNQDSGSSLNWNNNTANSVIPGPSVPVSTISSSITPPVSSSVPALTRTAFGAGVLDDLDF